MSEAELASGRSAETASEFGWTDALLLGMVVVWGLNFTVVKTALGEFLPLAFTSLRFVMASVLMVAAVRFMGLQLRLPMSDLRRIALLGLVGTGLYQPLFIFGIERTTAGNSSLILASVPVLVAVENHLLKLERLSAKAWTGVVLSFTGLLLVILGSSRGLSLEWKSVAGDLMTLGAAICWATYTVMSRPLLRKYPPLTVTTLSHIAGSIPLVLLALPSFAAQDWAGVSASGWAGLAYSGILGIGLAYIIWNTGVQRLGGARTSVYSNLVPVVAALAAAIFLGERFTVLQALGAAVIFAGIALTRAKRMDTGR